MASQYITFMIIFILGLSMVLLTNNMFSTLSDQFRENLAEIEMSQILDLIQSQIMQTLLFSSDYNQTIDQQLELPILLGQKFQYNIEIYNTTDNQVTLHGYSSDGKINQLTTFSVGAKYIIETSESSFQSIKALLTLHIERDANKVVITIL
ncbi:MAG: hypothetical protein ACFFB5_16420 [Promethearchaeota archaeon]